MAPRADVLKGDVDRMWRRGLGLFRVSCHGAEPILLPSGAPWVGSSFLGSTREQSQALGRC